MTPFFFSPLSIPTLRSDAQPENATVCRSSRGYQRSKPSTEKRITTRPLITPYQTMRFNKHSYKSSHIYPLGLYELTVITTLIQTGVHSLIFCCPHFEKCIFTLGLLQRLVTTLHRQLYKTVYSLDQFSPGNLERNGIWFV